MAFAAAFRETTAVSLGVTADQVLLSGISTDGDNVPGCSSGGPAAGGAMSISVTPEFAASLHPTAFDDCFLTPEEMTTSPAAMAFAQAFRETQAATLGVDPSTIQLSGISTGDNTGPGCTGANPAAQANMAIAVDPVFAASLYSGTAAADCYLSAAEIASDPQAQQLIQAFINAQATAIGVDPGTVQVSGISLDGDNTPGCSATQAVGVDIDPDFASTLGDPTAFEDCYLSPEEIASDPDAAAFAHQLVIAQAAAAGLDVSQVTLNGIHTDGNTILGCQGGESGRRLQRVLQQKKAKGLDLRAELVISIVR